MPGIGDQLAGERARQIVTTEETAEQFARSLTELRLEAGLSVRELSRKTDIPSGTLGGYFSGRHLPPANRPEVLDALVTACGGTPQECEAWRDRLVSLHQARRNSIVQRAPYRGLTGFTVEDHDLFFGREELTRELVAHVHDTGSGIVVVVGASGTGKSSLLRAGLVPALQRQGTGWVQDIITLGDEPSKAVDDALSRLGEQPGHPALLVVDQFEELFTLTPDEDERDTTVRRLVGWTQEQTDHPRVLLIGLRADHYGEAAAQPGLVTALRGHQVLVPPMTGQELRSAIERPAEQVGLKLEWGLADVILSDIRDSDVTHVLPHLSHTLQSMWEHGDRRLLRIRDYKSVGGVSAAVRSSAESAFAELGPERQQIARTLLLQLIALNPEAGPSRRVRSRQGLVGSHPQAAEVLDYLIDHRLVSSSTAEVTLSHEALIDAWPRLRRWVDEDRSDLLFRELLARQESTWRSHDRDPDLLLRGSLLETAKEWCDQHVGELSETEEEFVRLSEEQAASRHRERQRQHRRTRQLLAVAVAFALVAALAGIFALDSRSTAATQRDDARSRQMARVASTLGESDLSLASQVALAGYQIAQTRESRSALIDATAQPVLTRRLDDGAPITSASNRAGDVIAFGGSDGTVDLVRWDGERMTDVGTVTLDDEGTMVQTVGFDPTGAFLAVGGGAADLRVFDVSDPTAPTLAAELPVDRTVFDVGFSADGTWLVAAGDVDDSGAGAILLWQYAEGQWVEHDPFVDVEGSVRGLAVGVEHDQVAAATMSGTLYLWSLGGTGLELTGEIHVGDESSRQFDIDLTADGGRLAAVGSDRVVRVIDIDRDGALGDPVELPGFESWVNAVTFTPEGDGVVAGSSDSTLRLWDLPTDGRAPTVRAVLPISAAVTSLDVVDDRRIAVTTTGTSSYVWDRTAGVLPLAGDTVFMVRSTADGTRTITTSGTGDGTLYLWDTTAPRRPQLLSGLRAPAEMGVLDGPGAISRSGGTVVAGTSTGYVVTWDTTDPSAPRLLGGARVGESYMDQVELFDSDRMVIATSNDGFLGTVAVDQPDRVAERIKLEDAALTTAGSTGSLVVSGGTGGGVSLWEGHDLAAGPVATLDVELAIFALNFNADGTVLAVGGANSRVEIYDISTPTAPVLSSVLSGPAATVYSVEFSPDGSRLAAAALDGQAWVWRLAEDGYVSELVLHSDQVSLTSIGWVDDHHLLAGGHEGRTYLWLVDAPQAADIVCTTSGSPVTETEWTAHLPGIDYAPPCAQQTG